MIILSFQSQFLVLQLVKQWLTVADFMLIVVSNYLTTVKQHKTIFFFSKNYVSLERSPLDEAKKHKTMEKVEMSKMPTVNPLF